MNFDVESVIACFEIPPQLHLHRVGHCPLSDICMFSIVYFRTWLHSLYCSSYTLNYHHESLINLYLWIVTFFGIIIPSCLLMNVCIYCQWEHKFEIITHSYASCSAIFGHHQVVLKFLFALTVNTDVETNVICCRFARIVAHHPYVILVAVAVFAGTCLIIPLTTRKPPDFSDPQMVSLP